VQRTLKILSFVFIAIAFLFLWRQDLDAVFVAGVIGACCFFVAMRYEIEDRRTLRDKEREEVKTDKS
jgi:hypothetical protein